MPDFATPIVEGLTAAAGGAAQRVIWDQSERNGWIATGGLILAGVLGQNFFRQPMLQQISKAAMLSGATVAGWVIGEMNLIKQEQVPAADGQFLTDWKRRNQLPSGRPRVGHLPAYAGNGARAMAAAHVLEGTDVVELTEI